jgi:hypothetical protein
MYYINSNFFSEIMFYFLYLLKTIVGKKSQK